MRKYRNKKIEVDGIKFDSLKEARRYCDLRELWAAGEIFDLELQVKYELIPKSDKFRSMSYYADFVYKTENGTVIVEDVKGYRGGPAYAMFKVKQKLMYHVHKILVLEV